MRWLITFTVIVSVAHADPNRVVRGVVYDRMTSLPIDGASVIGQHATTTTTHDGTFAISLDVRERDLVVSATGYTMRTVALGNSDFVKIALVSTTPEVIEIRGRAPREPAPVERPLVEGPKAQSYVLSAEDLRLLPGTANDALRAAQVLPGVARLPYSFGGIVMRGSSPRDNIVYLDGIEVPLAFHFGGITSFYPSGMLEGLTVVNGGLDAAYGRAQGGMVEMTSREPRTDHWRTGGAFGLLDSGAFAEGPAYGGGIMIGVRRSYFDVVAAPLAADDTPMPSYLDAQVRASFGDPRFQGRIAPTLFMSIDLMEATSASSDGMHEDETQVTSAFARVAVPYDRRWGPLALRIVPWLGTNQLSFRSVHNDAVETFERPTYPGGLRVDLTRDVRWGQVRGGLDAAGGYVAHYQAGLGHTGDIVEQMNGDTELTWLDLALWSDAQIELGRFALKPGIRAEHYGLTDEVVVDPRLSLYERLTETLTLRETVGRYHQPPTPGDVDPNGGNPKLKSSYFDSASLGVEGTAEGGWSGAVTGFFSYGFGLGVRRPNGSTDFANLGTLGSTFSLLLEKQLGLAFTRDNIGRARNYGVEILLKRTVGRWFGLVSYTLSKAERTDNPGMYLGWRPFELDQTHNLNAAASVSLASWRLGARLQLVSGMPIGRPWNESLPVFFQLDVRADHSWPQCWGDITLYFDIQNVTNQQNVEGRDIDEDTGEVTDVHGLPILPFIGLELIPR